MAIIVGAVMPTYNQSGFLASAARSLHGQLDELAIVDDGSTDGTADMLRDLVVPLRDNGSLQVARHATNRGTADAINTGVALLPERCAWLSWVSSDNTYTPGWMDALTQHVGPDVGVVYSGFWYEKPGRPPRLHSTPYDPQRLLRNRNCFFGPSFIIRSDVWQPHRGRISHDYDNWLRVEEACWARSLRIIHTPEALCHYNAHGGRVTVTRKGEYDAHRWQREAVRRRRRARGART